MKVGEEDGTQLLLKTDRTGKLSMAAEEVEAENHLRRILQ